jgi:hypothetical protein
MFAGLGRKAAMAQFNPLNKAKQHAFVAELLFFVLQILCTI